MKEKITKKDINLILLLSFLFLTIYFGYKYHSLKNNLNKIEISDVEITEIELIKEGNLLDEYKGISYLYLKLNDNLFNKIKKINNNFILENIETSLPVRIYKLIDDRNIVLFSGCTNDHCYGTLNIIAYDINKDDIYMLVESEDLLKIYGNTDKLITDLLLKEYYGSLPNFEIGDDYFDYIDDMVNIK